MDLDNQNTTYKYSCPLCQYFTNKKNLWIKHTDTKKHQRNGQPKNIICNVCNQKFNNHWGLKQHKFINHTTIEERLTLKYYCSICNTVFFSQIYFDKHNNGKKHKLAIECLKRLNDVNEIVKNQTTSLI